MECVSDIKHTRFLHWLKCVVKHSSKTLKHILPRTVYALTVHRIPNQNWSPSVSLDSIHVFPDKNIFSTMVCTNTGRPSVLLDTSYEELAVSFL